MGAGASRIAVRLPRSRPRTHTSLTSSTANRVASPVRSAARQSRPTPNPTRVWSATVGGRGGRWPSILDFRFFDSRPLDPRPSTLDSFSRHGRICAERPSLFPRISCRCCTQSQSTETPPRNRPPPGFRCTREGAGDKKKKHSGRYCTNGRPAAIVAHCCISLCHEAAPSNAACSFAVSQFRTFARPRAAAAHIPRPALPPVCAILGLPPSPFTFQRASVIKNLLPDGCQPRFLLQPTLVAPSRLDSIACVAKRKSRDLIHLQIQQTRPRSKHTLTCRPR